VQGARNHPAPTTPPAAEASVWREGPVDEARDRVEQTGTIVVCGERFRTGTKVILWTDPPA
jgi:hypothetical protein